MTYGSVPKKNLMIVKTEFYTKHRYKQKVYDQIKRLQCSHTHEN